ncbi:MAG: class I SAM-dependent methyltransferase [Actinobacteria bacterium]|nr:class I SAM-dependent methyltransferase [Actinomycetota bacterium]
MARDRSADVADFDARAESYDTGRRARWHSQVVERSADVALAALPSPLRVLDVGCGTGALLSEMVVRVPYAQTFVGVDPAPRMLGVARQRVDPRVRLVRGVAEDLPFPDASFDLVLSSTSFDHWRDQAAGVAELARVVSDNGRVVLVDLAAAWLPRGGRARTPRAIRRLLTDAGLVVERRETVYRLGPLPFVRGFVAAL